MQNLIFTLNIVAPVFLIIFLGFFLKKYRLLNKNFISVSSQIVFTVTLPCLIFLKLATTDFKTAFNLRQIIFIYIGTIFYFIFSWLVSIALTDKGRDQSAFIQGSFRSNFVILGFALIVNMFGNGALGKAAILAAFVTPLYNILAVIALTVPVNKEKQISFKKTIVEVFTNPLILAVFIALPFCFLKISLPQFLIMTIDYLAVLTLTLALLGIGASLNFKSVRKDIKLAFSSTLIKIIIILATLTFLSYRLGFCGENLGVMFILFATPTAIATYIMAEAMDCNSELAGNIILMTTLGSIFTISLGIYVIKSIGLL